MARLREIRDGYANDVSKAERDLTRIQARLEAARTKLAVADEMIATLLKKNPSATNGVAAFQGMGKYASMPMSDAILDVINTHAGVEGLSANDIMELLVNDGVERKPNLKIAVHVTAGRLAERGAVTLDQTTNGKRFFKKIKLEEEAVIVAA